MTAAGGRAGRRRQPRDPPRLPRGPGLLGRRHRPGPRPDRGLRPRLPGVVGDLPGRADRGRSCWTTTPPGAPITAPTPGKCPACCSATGRSRPRPLRWSTWRPRSWPSSACPCRSPWKGRVFSRPKCMCRVATADGSRGFQPTVRDASRAVCRVATIEMAAQPRDTRLAFRRRYATQSDCGVLLSVG